EVPGEGDDFRDGAIERLGNRVAQFQPRQQAHQFGVLVDRHFVLAGDGQDRLRQFVVALGGEAGRVAAIVGEGNGLAWALVLLLHAVSSTQRCSKWVFGPCGGMPWRQLSSPTSRPAPSRRWRRLSSSPVISSTVAARSAHSWLDRLPRSSWACTCSGPSGSRSKASSTRHSASFCSLRL